jgi:hypothetical protein
MTLFARLMKHGFLASICCVGAMAAACADGRGPTTPSLSGAASSSGATALTPSLSAIGGGAATEARGGSALPFNATLGCTVDVGSTVHSLPLIHLIQAWLNISINNAASSLNCGQVESLNAKLNVVAEKVDQDAPNADAACGASTALVNELQLLVGAGRLATPNFPPPLPGGPTNVLMAAEALKAHWCDAAH